MAVTKPVHLIDKSAYEQRRHSEHARTLVGALVEEGPAATCTVIALEVLFLARNAADYEQLRSGLESLNWLEMSEPTMRGQWIYSMRSLNVANTGSHYPTS